jgi:hypothetical protein
VKVRKDDGADLGELELKVTEELNGAKLDGI